MKIGMTMAWGNYAQELSRFPATQVVRAFSASDPPRWSNARIQLLKDRDVIPFISHKTYSPAVFRQWLHQMPDDIPMVYLAHHHEAEADMDARTYRRHQREYWSVVEALPASIRSRVKFGPIQTKQWTENSAHSYTSYDPGIGDFWGVDAYANTWDLKYPDPEAWLNRILNFETTGRPIWFPELGVVRMPGDPRDLGRAEWIREVTQLLKESGRVELVMWWQDLGTPGAHVPGIGTERDFRLLRQPTITAWKSFTG